MAQLKDLLVEGKSRFIDKIYASDQFISKVVQGTSPFLIDSSTLVSNLNADLLDGFHAFGTDNIANNRYLLKQSKFDIGATTEEAYYRIATLSNGVSSNNRDALFYTIDIIFNRYWLYRVRHRGVSDSDREYTIAVVATNASASDLRIYYGAYNVSAEIFVKQAASSTTVKTILTKIFVEGQRGSSLSNYIQLDTTPVTTSTYTNYHSGTMSIYIPWDNITGKPGAATSYGYIGTTAVQAASTANQNLTGIGTIYIKGNGNSWTEGIRIKPNGGWATILLGGNDLTADTGTSANSWSLHNYNGSFYIAKNGSGTSGTNTAVFQNVSNNWNFAKGTLTSSNQFTAAARVIFSGLDSGASDVTDGTEILTSYASNNGFADSNGTGIVYRRQASKLYNYIKSKTDLIYAKYSDILDVSTNPSSNLDLNTRMSSTKFTSTSWDYAHATYILNQQAGSGASSAGTVFSFPGSYPFQIQRDYNSNNYYLRGYYSNTGWQPWVRIALSGESYTKAESDALYLPLAGGWMNWNAQIYFKGLNNSTSAYSKIGYATSASGQTMHCINSAGHQANGAFYITSNGSTSANDTGGLAIDNEGVTVFGAGDAGSNFTGIFRVLNEDNVADGPQFIVTKASGATTKYSHTAQRFISTVATGTQPYACTSTTLNTNLNADLLDGYHANNLPYYALGRNLNHIDVSTSWNGLLPINAFAFRHGKPAFDDPDFRTSLAGVSYYGRGQSQGSVTRMTDASAAAADSTYVPSGNSSGYVIKITDTSVTANNIGGFVQAVSSGQNKVWVQVFRAFLPVGATLSLAANSMGTGSKQTWLTSNVGTGKWEWYALLSINGNGSSYSTFGHMSAFLNGGTTSSVWYLSYCNSYELTNGEYDGLRTKFADSAISANSATSATAADTLKYQANLTTQEQIDNFLEASRFKVATFKTTDANNVGMVSNDGMLLSIPWSSTQYGAQIALDDFSDGSMKFRGKSTNWGDWRTVIHDGNYTTYTVTKTGGGASGTWGINISGSASSASVANWLNAQSNFKDSTGLGFAQTSNGPLNDSSTTGAPTGWASYIMMSHGNGQTYYHYQLGFPFGGPPMYQRKTGGSSTTENQSNWYTFVTTENYSSYLGYIGTTPVQASSANQALTGISSINGRLTIGANSDLTSIGFGGIHNVEFGEAGYAHREYYFRPSYGANGGTYASLNIQNASAAASPTFTTTHRFDCNGNAYHSGNIYLDTGDSDRFIQFRYNSNNYAGASWRLLSRGSGSGDTNYFDIETGGSSAGTNTWYRALRLTMDNRRVGLSVDAPTQKLHVGGNARFDGGIGSKGTNGNATGSYIAHPGGGVYATSTSSVTGYLKITLPTKGKNCMMSFDVTIYTYDGANQSYTTYHISGYEYSTNGWYEPVTKVYSEGIGPYTNLTVRLGNDGTYACVTIGEANTVWTYPQVTVHNVMTGFSGCDVDTWIGGWAVGFTTTALTTVVATRSSVNTQNINISGNADTVDGKHASEFATSGHTHSNYVLKTGDSMSGQLSIQTQTTAKTSPVSQQLVINGPTYDASATVDLKYYPGIGFHLPGRTWANLIWNGYFTGVNSDFSGYTGFYGSGFWKHGSSNDYVLLGAGGHKAISDFATSDHTHSTYVKYGGNQTGIGSGSPVNGAQTWCTSTNLPYGNALIYNSSGAEYSMLYSFRPSDLAYGAILRWGYTDKYLYIARKANNSWTDGSTNWAKIYAGYADSAGSATTASTLGTANVGAADRPIYLAAGVPTQTTYRMAGTNATATTAVAISSDLDTGIWYVNGTGTTDLYNISDGVAYVNKYSNSWIAEIYQDYRTGQIAVRGKNNGTWQAWRKVFDSVNYTSFLDGTYLKKVTVPNNAANDFNTFENMTLTGRGDPTTGASLSNAPWTGAGPAGGYGVLTYLWSGYGTQVAVGYHSNKVYIRNKYFNSGANWDSSWDSLVLTSELSNVSVGKIKTIASTATGNYYLTFVDSNNSSAADETVYTSAKLYIQPSTGNVYSTGKVFVNNTTTALGADNASVIWWANSSGYPLVASANVVRRGSSLTTGQLGDATYPWAEVHATKHRTANYELSESTNSRLSVGNAGQSVAKGLNVGDLLVSSAWADYTKVPTNGIYSKGQIKSGVAQGTAPLVVDSSTQVTNLKSNFAQYADVLRDPVYYRYVSGNLTSGRRTSADISWADGGLHYYLATSSMTTGKPAGDGHILHMSWDNGSYEGQFVLPTSTQRSLQWRSQNGGTWSSWITVLDSSNYTSYLSDTKVTQTKTASSNTSWRPLIIGASYSDATTFNPSTVTDITYATHLAKFKPSTGQLAIGGLYKMNTNGTQATGANDEVWNTNGTTVKISTLFTTEPEYLTLEVKNATSPSTPVTEYVGVTITNKFTNAIIYEGVAYQNTHLVPGTTTYTTDPISIPPGIEYVISCSPVSGFKAPEDGVFLSIPGYSRTVQLNYTPIRVDILSFDFSRGTAPSAFIQYTPASGTSVIQWIRNNSHRYAAYFAKLTSNVTDGNNAILAPRGAQMYICQLKDSDSTKFANNNSYSYPSDGSVENGDIYMRLPEFYYRVSLIADCSTFTVEFADTDLGEGFQKWDSNNLLAVYPVSYEGNITVSSGGSSTSSKINAYCSSPYKETTTMSAADVWLSTNACKISAATISSSGNTIDVFVGGVDKTSLKNLYPDVDVKFLRYKWIQILRLLFMAYYQTTDCVSQCGTGVQSTYTPSAQSTQGRGMTDTTSSTGNNKPVNFWGVESLWCTNIYTIYTDICWHYYYSGSSGSLSNVNLMGLLADNVPSPSLDSGGDAVYRFSRIYNSAGSVYGRYMQKLSGTPSTVEQKLVYSPITFAPGGVRGASATNCWYSTYDSTPEITFGHEVTGGFEYGKGSLFNEARAAAAGQNRICYYGPVQEVYSPTVFYNDIKPKSAIYRRLRGNNAIV